ncbi:hypothetical protein HFZ78_01795 [Priestia megaterium]|uniref:Uncharacterized protein n=1 Tax=Priestia megaterium TaxID=1404 RepID=A0A6H1NWF3_PRIMG|nr:hypothetical protein [Priestia megaterium]QIZ05630.1 hypothetical protein HFZ78_01795 [Priestia megaterium]
MIKKTAFDYHKELIQAKEFISSIEHTLEMIKSALPISEAQSEQGQLSEWENYSPVRALYLSQDDLKKVYTSAKKREKFIETKLSSYYF